MKGKVISELKADVRGKVILPEDQDYNEVRKVYNGISGNSRRDALYSDAKPV